MAVRNQTKRLENLPVLRRESAGKPAKATPVVTAAALLRAAMNREPVESLVEIAVAEMLETGRADRAGMWLLSDDEDQTLQGTVMQANGAEVPEHWLKLDSNLPRLRGLLQTEADEILVKGNDAELGSLGPMSRAAKALWLPLRIRGESLGLAMVIWKSAESEFESTVLRAVADAATLAIAERRRVGTQCSEVERTQRSSVLRARSEEAETQLASLAESVDTGIVLFDAADNLSLVNERFAQLVGIPLQLLREARTCCRVRLMIAEQVRDAAAYLERDREIAGLPFEASRNELEFVRPVRRILERSVSPVKNAEGRLLGRLEMYRDVTSQRLLQSKQHQTEKMAALGQLISGIAHELNNPLTSIMGYAQLLLGRRMTLAQTADARLIYQEAERAARIVKNLLLFAREAHPERRAVNLNDIVERAAALRNYELRLENIGLLLDLDPALPPVVADPAQLQQVLLNLLVNAEQAIRQGTGEGGIRIRTVKLEHGRVELEVADTGPGIPAEVIPRIFDPFFTTKPAGVGTGLGLSIACSIVQEHGGEISVESQPGQGAKFTIELPVAKGEAVVPSGDGLRRMATSLHSGAMGGERILIVEDEPTVANLIADVLGEEGHPVEVVLDARVGLEKALSGQFDLVICDLKMPRLDGKAFFRELVAKGSDVQSKIVFVTGDTMAPHTMDFLESSGLPYLSKPFLVEELKAVVAGALLSAAHFSSRMNGQARAPLVKETLRRVAGAGAGMETKET